MQEAVGANQDGRPGEREASGRHAARFAARDRQSFFLAHLADHLYGAGAAAAGVRRNPNDEARILESNSNARMIELKQRPRFVHSVSAFVHSSF